MLEQLQTKNPNYVDSQSEYQRFVHCYDTNSGKVSDTMHCLVTEKFSWYDRDGGWKDLGY